ncbi:hypothetical protein OROMI_033707 [Orobanche minor]
MGLVVTTKRQLQDLRENGWDDLLGDVNSFCSKNDISIPNMEDNISGRLRRKHTFFHHFRVEIFCQVVDRISQEMENRFTKTNTELLMCISCLDPKNLFSNYSSSGLVRLAELYPQDFSADDRMELAEQLKMWISEMRGNAIFSKLENVRELTTKMVEVRFYTIFHLVYLLIKLALVLPVATASVERAFSAMNIVKTYLRNKMGDEFLTDCMVCYVEKDIFFGNDNEVIIQHFQAMGSRRLDLPPLPRV